MRKDAGGLFLAVLRSPTSATALTTSDWEVVLRTARAARLLPRLAVLFDQAGVTASLPVQVQHLLAGDRPIAAQHERIVRWEVNRIGAALSGIGMTVVLLKGAAYVMAGLPAAPGRLVTDVDIMVPRERLRDVEQALLANGWEAVTLDAYDQRFYREWTHELPPLQHRRRRSVVDVHHTILPVSGRLHPDAAKLISSARPLPGPGRAAPGAGDRDLGQSAGFWVLGPEDMVLHNAVHLFQDGDLAGCVRDLVDADALLRHFASTEPGFEARLEARAAELGLGRPMYYTARYASRLLGTPVLPSLERFRPPGPVLALMDVLARRALLPVTSGGTAGENAARLLLYIRSHWLRMPARRLAAHLGRKAVRRWWRDED